MRKLNSSIFFWGAYRRPNEEKIDNLKKWIWDFRREEMKSGLEKKNYRSKYINMPEDAEKMKS